MIHSACCNSHWLLFQNPRDDMKAFVCCAVCGDLLGTNFKVTFAIDSDDNKIDEEPVCVTCSQPWEFVYNDGWKLICPECDRVSTAIVVGPDPRGDSENGECSCDVCRVNREEAIKNN